jgi:hypothetical protein
LEDALDVHTRTYHPITYHQRREKGREEGREEDRRERSQRGEQGKGEEDTSADVGITQLMASSLFSIAALAFTIILHCFVGLRPDLNIAINSFNGLLWTLSWSLLTWYLSPTLRHMCDIEHWSEETGVFVCRIYKGLFTFAFLGMYVPFEE